MGLFEDRKQRSIELSKDFSAEQLQGARWDVPGLAEASKKLDGAGLAPRTIWKPETPSQS